MFGSFTSWWVDPVAGIHMSALDWFLFFGLFSVSLLIWGVIVSDIVGAV